MMETVSKDWLETHVNSLAITFVWFLLSFFLFWRKGFFKMPSSKTPILITFWKLLSIFCIYLLINILIAPLLFNVVNMIVNPNFANNSEMMGVLYLLSIFCSLLGIFLYLFWVGKEIRIAIFFPNDAERDHSFNPFFKGSITWFIAYPCAAVFGQIIAIVLFLFANHVNTEQSAIRYLKQVQEFPFLYGALIFCIIFIVPIIEETLFRGFLLNWLKKHLGRWWAIGLSAFIFAVFHFGPAQGLGNIEIIASLWILAIFLGILYERVGSLWAPIGLHATFNAVTVLFLTFFS